MTVSSNTALASILAKVEMTDKIEVLASAFYDQAASFRLAGCGSSAPVGIGAHLRRSFLGALGAGASPAAVDSKPCTWDPPCALDVFRREQLRGGRGDGLPKPYVIECTLDGADLIVTLRIFGMANDWFMVASEAMVSGIRTILPWSKLIAGRNCAPHILSRQVHSVPLAVAPEGAKALRLVFISPIDIGGSNPLADPHRLLSRMLRRVDGISRWNGLGLSDDAGRAFANHVKTLSYETSEIQRGGHLSPNARGQRRAKEVITGTLTVRGDIASIWPVLVMGQRCHLGRGAVEGLGAFCIELVD